LQILVRKKGRMDSLDAMRGVAILAMVFYHGLYDLCDIFDYSIPVFGFFRLFEPLFAGLFILLAGVSSRYSHSNVKRGVRVLLLGLAVTAATVVFIPSQSILFGILHFMGCAILLFALVHPVTDRIPPVVAFILWAGLFAVTYAVPQTDLIGIPGLFGFSLPHILQNTPYLFWLGLPDANFFSADYFPLIPWFFLFMVGTIVGIPIKAGKLPEKFYTAHIPFLAAAGRNTLLIYVLHQPIIYGLLWLFYTASH
jgi:uncharacterized membrane protein